MKTFLIAVLFCLLSISFPRAQAEDLPSSDLIFVGVVTEIVASPLKNSDQNWMISVEIQTVESGQFDGKKMSFRIHSPGRAGVVVGKRYRFHAAKADRGYTVDELKIEVQN